MSYRKHLDSGISILFESVSEHFLIASGMLVESNLEKDHDHER